MRRSVRARTARSFAKRSKSRLHLGDLGELALNNVAAELLDLRVCNRLLATHQHRPGVVRDHQFQKLNIADGEEAPACI
jgi:hypothetical protein